MEQVQQTMRDFIILILGEYQPNLSPEGTVLGGLYSLDFTWITGAVVFVIFVYSVLRIINSFINRR